MKTQYLIVLLLLGFTMAAQAQGDKKAQKAEATAQEFQKTLDLVKTNCFQIKIDRVFPSGGQDVSRFNPSGTITLRDSVAEGQLPFFGRAYSSAYGGDGGIEFNAAVEKRSLTVNEKKRMKTITYKFTVSAKTLNDRFAITTEISPNGKCMVTVNSNNRTAISYSGTVEELPTRTGKD